MSEREDILRRTQCNAYRDAVESISRLDVLSSHRRVSELAVERAKAAIAEAAACPPKSDADAVLNAAAVIDAVLAEWPHRECGGMVEYDNAYLAAVKAGKSKTIADRLGAKALLDAFAAEVKQRLAS